jgi:hypothetical protein
MTGFSRFIFKLSHRPAVPAAVRLTDSAGKCLWFLTGSAGVVGGNRFGAGGLRGGGCTGGGKRHLRLYADALFRLPGWPESIRNAGLARSDLVLPCAWTCIHLTNRRLGPAYAFAHLVAAPPHEP